MNSTWNVSGSGIEGIRLALLNYDTAMCRTAPDGRRHLILLPSSVVAIYVLSYAYLAYYHKQLFLFATVVHESGRYTLLENIFYASHFLGHIPVYTMLAFYFVGTYRCLTRNPLDLPSSATNKKRVWAMAILLAASAIIAFAGFGVEDTINFILQKKQGVGIYQQGGSWNLHLPSSLTLFLLIPIYLTVFRWIYRKPLSPSTDGVLLVLIGMGLFFFFTLLVNYSNLEKVLLILSNPRYLAHSVRELATFPLTYFPLPLYLMLRNEVTNASVADHGSRKALMVLMVVMGIFLLMALSYQCFLPLSVGIGELAQKPAFAKNGKLGIAYLLASHYFEHFLDSIYFTLACLILLGWSSKKHGSFTIPG